MQQRQNQPYLAIRNKTFARRGFTDRASYGSGFSVPETRLGFAKLAAGTRDSTCISAITRTPNWREVWIVRGGGGITATGPQVVHRALLRGDGWWFSFLLLFLSSEIRGRKPRIRGESGGRRDRAERKRKFWLRVMRNSKTVWYFWTFAKSSL